MGGNLGRRWGGREQAYVVDGCTTHTAELSLTGPTVAQRGCSLTCPHIAHIAGNAPLSAIPSASRST